MLEVFIRVVFKPIYREDVCSLDIVEIWILINPNYRIKYTSWIVYIILIQCDYGAKFYILVILQSLIFGKIYLFRVMAKIDSHYIGAGKTISLLSKFLLQIL